MYCSLIQNLLQCAQSMSGITFIMYLISIIGKPNNSNKKSLAINPRGQRRIAKKLLRLPMPENFFS